MALTADQIATKASEYKTAYAGLGLALVALLHPALPILEFYARTLNMPPDSPLKMVRHDGTTQSDDSLRTVLTRAAALPGAGLHGDVLAFAAMHGATRLGDDLIQGGLMSKSDATLQFARHLRNGCAHGNRWHFRNGEPKHPASLRGRQLDPTLHGSQIVNEWLAPGDYLDFLDDLAATLRARNKSK